MEISLSDIQTLGQDPGKEIGLFYLGQLYQNRLNRLRQTINKKLTTKNKDDLLIEASEKGLLHATQLLVKEYGANPVAHDNLALIFASVNGRLSVVQFLLSQPGVDPAAQEYQALILASSIGHLPVVEFLLSKPGSIPPL